MLGLSASAGALCESVWGRLDQHPTTKTRWEQIITPLPLTGPLGIPRLLRSVLGSASFARSWEADFVRPSRQAPALVNERRLLFHGNPSPSTEQEQFPDDPSYGTMLAVGRASG